MQTHNSGSWLKYQKICTSENNGIYVVQIIVLAAILMNRDSSKLKFRNWRRIRNKPTIILCFQNILSRKVFRSFFCSLIKTLQQALFLSKRLFCLKFWKKKWTKRHAMKGSLKPWGQRLFDGWWNDSIIIDNTYLNG